MLQIAWANIADLPTSTRWTSRSHSPDQLFTVFDDIIARTAVNFVSNFLLALPKDFIRGNALKNAVNSNSRLEALQSREDLLSLLSNWKPAEVFPIRTFRKNPRTQQWVDEPDYYEPIGYWMKIMKVTIADSEQRLGLAWPTFKNSFKRAFSKLEQAIWSTELVDTCITKLSKILVILVKRPQELFYAEPWIANHGFLAEHLGLVFS